MLLGTGLGSHSAVGVGAVFDRSVRSGYSPGVLVSGTAVYIMDMVTALEAALFPACLVYG